MPEFVRSLGIGEQRKALKERVRREQQLMDRLRTATLHFVDAHSNRTHLSHQLCPSVGTIHAADRRGHRLELQPGAPSCQQRRSHRHAGMAQPSPRDTPAARHRRQLAEPQQEQLKRLSTREQRNALRAKLGSRLNEGPRLCINPRKTRRFCDRLLRAVFPNVFQLAVMVADLRTFASACLSVTAPLAAVSRRSRRDHQPLSRKPDSLINPALGSVDPQHPLYCYGACILIRLALAGRRSGGRRAEHAKGHGGIDAGGGDRIRPESDGTVGGHPGRSSIMASGSGRCSSSSSRGTR